MLLVACHVGNAANHIRSRISHRCIMLFSHFCACDVATFVMVDPADVGMLLQQVNDDELELMSSPTDMELEGVFSIVSVPGDGNYLWVITDDATAAVQVGRHPNISGYGVRIRSGKLRVCAIEFLGEPETDSKSFQCDMPPGQYLVDGFYLEGRSATEFARARGVECPEDVEIVVAVFQRRNVPYTFTARRSVHEPQVSRSNIGCLWPIVFLPLAFMVLLLMCF